MNNKGLKLSHCLMSFFNSKHSDFSPFSLIIPFNSLYTLLIAYISRFGSCFPCKAFTISFLGTDKNVALTSRNTRNISQLLSRLSSMIILRLKMWSWVCLPSQKRACSSSINCYTTILNLCFKTVLYNFHVSN